jgi:hypothetical protein
MAAKKSSGRRKYGKAAGKSVKRAMHKAKRGTLKSGKGRHPKVKSREQAIAIGLSEARASGAKVPRKSSRKKSTRKKSTRKRSTAKKGGARKKSTRKSTRKRSSARKRS